MTIFYGDRERFEGSLPWANVNGFVARTGKSTNRTHVMFDGMSLRADRTEVDDPYDGPLYDEDDGPEYDDYYEDTGYPHVHFDGWGDMLPVIARGVSNIGRDSRYRGKLPVDRTAEIVMGDIEDPPDPFQQTQDLYHGTSSVGTPSFDPPDDDVCRFLEDL